MSRKALVTTQQRVTQLGVLPEMVSILRASLHGELGHREANSLPSALSKARDKGDQLFFFVQFYSAWNRLSSGSSSIRNGRCPGENTRYKYREAVQRSLPSLPPATTEPNLPRQISSSRLY